MIAALGLLPPLTADEAAPVVDVEVQSCFTSSSRLGPDGGEVSQWSNLVDLFLPVAGSSRSGLGLDLIVQHLGFRFRDFAGFMPGRSAPLAAANVVTLQPAAIVTPTPPWSFVGSGTFQYARGGNARWGDAVLWSGSVGALYQYGVDRRIGLGLQVAERMRAPPLILPFPLIDWRISDRWSLTALDGTSGRLSCRVTAAWSVIGKLEFLSQDIRMSSSAAIPSGILRYEAFPLSIGVECRPSPHLTVSAAGGAALAQQFRFLDERGQLLRTSAIHSPWIGTLDIDYGF